MSRIDRSNKMDWKETESHRLRRTAPTWADAWSAHRRKRESTAADAIVSSILLGVLILAAIAFMFWPT